ncbi:3-dehydroquinate synthase, partial [Pseudomonadota bacterium]
MKNVSVKLQDRSYEIIIGKGILNNLGLFLLRIRKPCNCVIITNPTVSALYESIVKKSLISNGFSVFNITIPDSETSKSIRIVEQIYKQLVDLKINRDSCIIALGGGVI